MSAAVLALLIAGCGEVSEPSQQEGNAASDPLIARALADALMVDPDLAYRNEANAAVTVRYDHPLPALTSNDELANQARNAAEVELLLDGTIVELPMPSNAASPADLLKLTDATQLIRAVGGPEKCSSLMKDGLEWSVDMPLVASIMPHGMVHQAAGVNNRECNIRIVRYRTPAKIDDVLQYHFTRADRARLRPVHYQSPEHAVIGDGRIEKFVAVARPGAGGMTAVDLIYWAK